MQKDFHFYAIYVLCRCQGMSPQTAHTVAYASQHTDDAKYDHALNFENGGRFQQVLSAHKFVDPGAFTLATQYSIYVPFHFLPGNQGDRFQERMVCRQNSDIAQQMVVQASNLKGKAYQLHRLGIALHVYADTWSHQDFSGLQTDLNDIDDVDVINEERSGIAKIFTRFFRDTTEALLPHLGHAEAATLPDEPFRQWSFYNPYQQREISIKNWLRCQDACRVIYQVLKRFVAKNPQYRHNPPARWGDIKPVLNELFKKHGDLDQRCDNWIDRINASAFGFTCLPDDRNLIYDDRRWFNAAVEVQTTADPEDADTYIRKDNFHNSHWKHFHDAAASHHFFVLQELLAPQGIICG